MRALLCGAFWPVTSVNLNYDTTNELASAMPSRQPQSTIQSKTMVPSCFIFVVCSLFIYGTQATSSVIGVRVLLDEGRKSGLGNPCSPKERELMKRALRVATTKTPNSVVQTTRQPRSCEYLCEEFDNCYLAHPKCAAKRTIDEEDHRSNHLNRIGIERFASEHVVEEEICNTDLTTTDDIAICNDQKSQIRDTMKQYLETHLSPKCLNLLHKKIGLTCFRL